MPASITPEPGQIVVTGTVPDEASKVGILNKLREVYGHGQVIDQISVANVVLPANWNNKVQKLINADLQQIHHGQLNIEGTNITLHGEVSNEAQRQTIVSQMAHNLDPSFTIKNNLHVAANEQFLLDKTLANRIVEFEPGKATLTPKGLGILDEMAAALLKIKDKKLDIIGHTDNSGLRASNVNLSKARAEAVKAYLVDKGISPDLISTIGQGADAPIASNDSSEGRARNRRIEFRIAN